jgi:hypothetical protein
MKKILATTLIVVLIAALSVGVVIAEEVPPTTPTRPGRYNRSQGVSSNGILAEYTQQAIADLLGITLEEYEAYKLTGASFYDIAADLGIAPEKMVTLQADARELARQTALADGMLTETEAQSFQERVGNGQGGWHQGGRGLRNGNGGGQFGTGLYDGTGECDTWIYEPTP